MANFRVNLLPDLHAAGPTQMAADEWMLESAREGAAWLRFYTWEVATLSLGYFQNHADRLAGLPLVRRPTGGGAIVHHHELTYSFALPPGDHWQPGGESWVCRFHHVLLDAFALLGVTVRACGCGEERGRGSYLCFEHHTPGDLLIGTDKVVGSAQRRPRGALLQHGSILLSASEHAPQLPGIGDLRGLTFSPAELKAAVLHTLRVREAWEIEPSEWPTGCESAIDSIAAEKFTSPAWNEKR